MVRCLHNAHPLRALLLLRAMTSNHIAKNQLPRFNRDYTWFISNKGENLKLKLLNKISRSNATSHENNTYTNERADFGRFESTRIP